jgi:hypothetical protein
VHFENETKRSVDDPFKNHVQQPVSFDADWPGGIASLDTNVNNLFFTRSLETVLKQFLSNCFANFRFSNKQISKKQHIGKTPAAIFVRDRLCGCDKSGKSERFGKISGRCAENWLQIYNF